MKVDLHTHTTCSDGKLSPEMLITRAIDNGVSMLAITDHDNVEAHRHDLTDTRLQVISGLEISSQWQGMGIHVVGLNVDIQHPLLLHEIKQQQQRRRERSELICQKLNKKGLTVDYNELIKAIEPHRLGRPHIAEYLVQTEQCKDIAQAFRKYLAKKEFGGGGRTWVELSMAVKIIVEAGGVAVLAHPNHYKLTRSKLKRLLKSFKETGGLGLEVISGFQPIEVTEKFALLCLEYQLLASTGSDFHQAGNYRCDVGANIQLPGYLSPVWQVFNERRD